MARARKRDRYGKTIQAHPEYLKARPVGQWFFSYDWITNPTEHRLSPLTPDTDMLRDTHRYALCGFGPIDVSNGHPCICKPGYEHSHCKTCDRIKLKGLVEPRL